MPARSTVGPCPAPAVSVIIPVYNDSRNLEKCLVALGATAPSDTEIVVVDDGSIDDPVSVAARAGVRLVRLTPNSGPAAARNLGARHVGGEILLFIDADVLVQSGIVERVAAVFAADPDLAAVFGSYDAQPRAAGLVSRYRNLLHHFVHQHGNPDASTFWAGCGAVRRAPFEALGGFDEQGYPRAIEDIELGYRLRAAGHRIRLDKQLQVTHLKRWTFWSVLKTDVAHRAWPWSRLILERATAPDELNLKMDQRLSVALVLFATLCVVLVPVQRTLLAPALAALLGVAALNHRLYTFFYRQHGLAFAAACIPLHFLYYLYSGVTYLVAWFSVKLWDRGAVARHSRPPTSLPDVGRPAGITSRWRSKAGLG